MSCKYKDIAKCKSCDFITFNDCKQFRYLKVKELIYDLCPITLRRVPKLSPNKIYYSSNEDLARQFAANLAIYLGHKVIRVKLNQALSLVLEGSRVNSKVVYLEAKKIPGEQTKIQQAIESFLDKQLLSGSTIIIFNNNLVLKPQDDWTKLKEESNSKVEEEDL